MGNNKFDQDEIVSEINMTPLIDIMLVLLIIFMVSSSAVIESGADITLPESKSVSAKNDAALVVSLTSDGQVALQGEKVSIENLKAAIEAQVANLKTDSIILEGDGESQLSATMEIMDIAKSAGIKNFSIAAKLKQ